MPPDNALSSQRKRVVLAIVGFVVSLCYAPVNGVSAQSLSELSDQYDSKYEAENYSGAEAIARQGLAIADRGDDQEAQIAWLDLLGDALFEQDGKELAAAEYFQRSLELEKALRGPKHRNIAIGLRWLGNCYYWADRYAKAAPLYQQAIALHEELSEPDDSEIISSLNQLGNTYVALSEYGKAQPLLVRALKLNEQKSGADSLDAASCANDLAVCLFYLDKYQQAMRLSERALKIYERDLGPQHIDTTACLMAMGNVSYALNKYDQANTFYQRALAIYEAELGPQHLDTTESLSGMGDVSFALNKFDQASTFYERALVIRERELGSEHADTLHVLNGLANVQLAQGRYAEAEPLLRQVIATRERIQGADHYDIWSSLCDLALLYARQGQYTKAELLYQRAQKILENQPSPSHRDAASTLYLMAETAIHQNKHKLAESLYKQSIARLEKTFDNQDEKGDLDLAWDYHGLGYVFLRRKDYSEAELQVRRALAIFERTLGSEDYSVAACYQLLGMTCVEQGKYEEAEKLYSQELEITEKALGADHPDNAFALTNFAELYRRQKTPEKGLSLIDRAITMFDRINASAENRAEAYFVRAQIAWDLHDRSDALADLRKTMSLAEQQRALFSGGERQRAAAFSNLLEPFELMVQWQLELGDVSEALGAIERAKARSLLDELRIAGADLQAGRSSLERKQLQEQRGDLQARVFELEKRLAAAKTEDDRNSLTSELAPARKALYAHHEKTRSSSPVYRNLLSVGAAPPRLSQVRRNLLREGDLLLVYYFGEKAGYLISMNREGEQLVKLQVEPDQAQVLEIDVGPLNAEQLKDLLSGDKNSLLSRLRKRQVDSKTEKKLAALARVLLPGDLLRTLSTDQVKHLLVVPDGPLALLPFETLVIETRPQTSYLLDRGPPIDYGPSTTVLLNLRRRAATKDNTATSVLTVGNPFYGTESTGESATMLASLTTRSAYRAAGGKLSALPFSGLEAKWVESTFQKQGVTSQRFEGSNATEANIRNAVPGRQIVHFACHGLVDQSYGNFFGSLALSPGPQTDDASDDGFLTLPEICNLNLQGCELTILSACDTNFGPQQQGEGVWSLSRGFLVAGSQRVVASSWLVDDEAAASIVSVFCSYIARSKAKGEQPNYAEALQKAKQWARKQSKWDNPYFWGSFVLVGPG